MILNKAEFFLMNNPLRDIITEHIEIRRLKNLIYLPPDSKVLEIGCGNGNGSRLLKKHFAPREIYAIDLDKRMIAIAKKKHSNKSIIFEVHDAAKLPYKDKSFEAVFDLGVLHHIPNWKDCLNELKRVLKPQGQLILEDLSTETFSFGLGRLFKKILHHPYDAMYNEEELLHYLKRIGFKIDYHITNTFLLRHFIVIARRN